MAVGRVLVVLEKSTPPQTAQGVIAAIEQIGTVEFEVAPGRAVIATFDGVYTESVRSLPRVQLVGGVRTGRKTVAHEQVRTD